MNNEKRKTLKNILLKIKALHDELNAIRNHEIEYRDSIPDHLINSKRYNKSDEAVDSLGGAIEDLSNVIEYIENSIKNNQKNQEEKNHGKSNNRRK